MENNPQSTPASSAPIGEPSATPAPSYPPGVEPVNSAPVNTPTPPMQMQSVDSGSGGSWFEGLDWVLIGFGILLSVGGFYMINFYRYKTKTFKADLGNLTNRVLELEAQSGSDEI